MYNRTIHVGFRNRRASSCCAFSYEFSVISTFVYFILLLLRLNRIVHALPPLLLLI